VVVDTRDPEVVDNILRDLPLEQAFTPGKTNMHSGVAAAAEIAAKWPANSATLIVASDGDSLPARKAPELPRAFADVLVLGVGDPLRGTYIHDHSSRQDRESLARLAIQLGGVYHDANERHVASGGLVGIAPAAAQSSRPFALREAAIAAVVGGAAVLAVLPLALGVAGGAFNIRRARPTFLDDSSVMGRERHSIPN
jgi:Ca-activated chloride channel family protein